MAPQLDHMLPQLVTLSGVTKKLTAKAAGNAMDTVCATVGYTPRLIAHVCDAFKEKATNSRLLAAGWLTEIFKSYGKHLDPVKDFPRIDIAFVTGLQDSQNGVREALRPTYWRYTKISPENAAAIMDKLPKDKANALKNHPDNPDRPADAGRPARPASALSQIKARSKANFKQSTTAKPPTDTQVAATDKLNTSTSSTTAPRPHVGTMSTAPARMPHMARSTTAPQPGWPRVAQASVTSTHSSDHHIGSLDKLDAPDGAMLPLPPSPKHNTFQDMETRAHLDKAVAQKKKVRHGPEYGDKVELSTSEKARHEDAPLRHFASKYPDKAADVSQHVEEETFKGKVFDNASLRNLMAAPVRRPRVVATPMNQSQSAVRPSSRGDSKKTLPTGRQTPTLSGRETPTEELPIRGHKKQASSRSGRHTPTLREDSSHQKKPSVSRAKTAPVPVTSSRPTSSSSSAMLNIEVASDPVDTTPTTTQASDTTLTEAEPVKPVQVPRIIDGKENAFTYNDGCTHKKAYEACTAKTKDARVDVAKLKDALKAGKLDALGHKKLSGMLKDKPGQLVTSQKDFEDLYTILVHALAANAAVKPPPGTSVKNPGHPFYNRHALIDSITRLLQQFPEAGEPQPGMAILAVIKCRASHNDGERFRTAATIDKAVESLVRLTRDDNVLAATNNVAEYIADSGERDTAVLGLGFRALEALLGKAAALGQRLFETSERLMIEALNVEGVPRQDAMKMVAALRGLVPQERLEALFVGEDDRNLAMYYLTRA